MDFFQFIADSFYTLGLASKFVHLFIATLHFPNKVIIYVIIIITIHHYHHHPLHLPG